MFFPKFKRNSQKESLIKNMLWKKVKQPSKPRESNLRKKNKSKSNFKKIYPIFMEWRVTKQLSRKGLTSKLKRTKS